MSNQPHLGDHPDATRRPYPYPLDANQGAPRTQEPGVTVGDGRQVSSDERAAAIMAHLSAPIAAIVSAGSLSLLGPLVVWLIYRNKSSVVREAAAGAFNFNLSWWLLYWVGWLFFVTVIGALVAVPLWIVIGIVGLWCHIRGAMKAGDGRHYRYPFQLRVLR